MAHRRAGPPPRNPSSPYPPVMTPGPHTVTMYSRPRCGLCDEARRLIQDAATATAFEYREVSIEGDEALERAYGLRIPVVLVDGEEEFELHVDFRRLRTLLA